ncbi:MAG TPA: glycosyltransferase, partial [Blastocatellia bacterium]|nr:glycosyltransferase [Blastocatellia bacterium]
MTKGEKTAPRSPIVPAKIERRTERLESTLRRKDRTIAALRAQLARQEQSLESRLAEKDQQLQALSLRVSEQLTRLDAIDSSIGARILSRYGKLKYGVLLPALRAIGLKRPLVSTAGLQIHIDREIFDLIAVGRGTAIYLSGWCYHPTWEIRKLQAGLNGHLYPMKAAGIAMPGVTETSSPDQDPNLHSYRSGFWTILPLPSVEQTTRIEVEINAILSNGETHSQVIATSALAPVWRTSEILSGSLVETQSGSQVTTPFPSPEWPQPSRPSPLVAICMTTFNPPLNLFERQIQSIVDQTHSRWICVITDDGSRPEVYERISALTARDARFRLNRNAETLGFYRNFETCLSLAPREADFVALCDHDDYWHPGKLAALLGQFDERTTLVYSDMNIVDEEGVRLANTYWTTRRNNYEDFASLIFANTITGAALMIPRSLLGYILPFPERIGEAYHDHWIACVAMAMGQIKYVDSPLYDYVQHSSNVLGHYAPRRETIFDRLAGLPEALRSATKTVRHNLVQWAAVYFCDLVRLQVISHILLLRCAPHLTSTKSKVLKSVRDADGSFLALAWLWLRSLRNIGRSSETLGAENRLLRAVLWKKQRIFKSHLSFLPFGPWSARACRRAAQTVPQPVPKVSESGPGPSQMLAVTAPEPEHTGPDQRVSVEAGLEGAPDPSQSAISLYSVEAIRQRLAPLRLNVSRSAPKRVNLIIPTVDPKYVFGGYITKFNLARRLAETGFNARIVAIDHCDCPPSLWAQQLQGFQGLGSLFENVETAYAFDRAVPLEVSPDDVFIATTWWTAHIAHQAARDLGRRRFLYLIQEYEPFTFPMGTFASLATQTYSLPHYAIFSTEFLRDYFRQNRLGVFADGCFAGEADSISFQNTITSTGEITLDDISARSPKRLLLYARPEQHAARNMFEVALLALSEALKRGYFTGDWEFDGIGTVGSS